MTKLAIKRGELLVNLRKQTSCPKRVDFCKKYNIPVPTMKAWESGIHEEISTKGIKKLVEAFQQEGVECNSAYILNAGESQEYLSLANSIHNFSLLDLPPGLAQEICTHIDKNYQNLEIVQIINNSLHPFVEKNDLIVGKPVKLFDEIEQKNYGKLHIIRTINDCTYVMFLEKTTIKNIVLLRTNTGNNNFTHLNTSEIRSISTVLFIAKSN
mgnify:CR=1 FL=1